MLKTTKGKILFLNPKRMDDATPIVIDGIDHRGTFGERLGRVYTLRMSGGSIRKAYLMWDSGDADYFFSSLLKKGFENAPDPEAHLSTEKCEWLSALLQKFDEETLFGLNNPHRGNAQTAGTGEPKKAVLGS